VKTQYGMFDVEVWQGGYPVWVHIRDAQGNELKFQHGHLRDLQHAVKQARRVARAELPDDRKEEA
jgi:hypothetical protein